ncbi:MAG: tRNA pseudouridine(55) synthase TruB [Candidatus Aminicenantales bacterium]|jgi:tRNA pseudouridine55 synthase
MDGLLIIDKPRGCTSHDVVLRVRSLLKLKRVGHGGTLDPDATGVLLVALGRATRFFPYLSGQDKTYEGTIRLGFATDTYDASGRPASEEKADSPPFEAVAAAMRSLEGEILQVPPPYSAKKIGGSPAYKLARARKEFTLEPVRVIVRSFALRNYAPPFVEFEAVCSSGTYIRSLAHDLGLKIGGGAHLHSLRRTSVGPYTVGEAVSLAGIEEALAGVRLPELVIPLEELLPGSPAVALSKEATARVLNGAPLFPKDFVPLSGETLSRADAGIFRVIGPSGRLLALARPSADGDRLLPLLVVK